MFSIYCVKYKSVKNLVGMKKNSMYSFRSLLCMKGDEKVANQPHQGEGIGGPLPPLGS